MTVKVRIKEEHAGVQNQLLKKILNNCHACFPEFNCSKCDVKLSVQSR